MLERRQEEVRQTLARSSQLDIVVIRYHELQLVAPRVFKIFGLWNKES